MLKLAVVVIAMPSLFLHVQAQTTIANVMERRLQTNQGWRIRIENVDPNSIVAFHVSVRCPANAGHGKFEFGFRFDPLLNYGFEKPIPSGGHLEVPISPDTAECPGGLDAVVFSDGHSSGNPDAIQDVYRRRVGVTEAITFAAPLLNNLIASSIRSEDFSTTLRAEAKTVSKNQAKSEAEREAEMFVFTLLAGLVEDPHEWQVPSDLTTRKQPGIEYTMRERGLSRDIAHAIVLKRKIEEWASDLQGHLEPAVAK